MAWQTVPVPGEGADGASGQTDGSGGASDAQPGSGSGSAPPPSKWTNVPVPDELPAKTDDGGSFWSLSGPGYQNPAVTGVAHQLETGLEASPYRILGAPADVSSGIANMTRRALGYPVPQGVMPGGYDWWTQQAGKIHPALNPENYPATNAAERIARSAGEVAGQSMALGAGVPSSVGIAKQLTGSGLSGLASGASSQGGKEATAWTIDNLMPGYRQQYPTTARIAEQLAGVGGGFAGGLAGPGVASETQIPQTSTKELLDTGGQQMNQAKQMGVKYSPSSVTNFAFNTQQNLLKDIDSAHMQTANKWLKIMMNAPQGATHVPMTEMAGVSAKLRDFAKDQMQGGQMSQEGRAALRTHRAIDDFMTNPPQGSVLTDPVAAQQAAQTFSEGKANYAAGKRSQTLETAQKYAKGDPQKLQSRLDFLTNAYSPQRLWGFSPEERTQLENVGQSPLQKVVGGAQNIFGLGHGGHGAYAASAFGAAGGHYGGPEGLLLAGIPLGLGYGAKKVNQMLTNRAYNAVAEQTRQRAPLYQQQGAPFAPSAWRYAPAGLGAIQGMSTQP
jgi:hypothetical protein